MPSSKQVGIESSMNEPVKQLDLKTKFRHIRAYNLLETCCLKSFQARLLLWKKIPIDK